MSYRYYLQFAVLFSLLNMSCAHKIKKSEFPPSERPQEVISQLNDLYKKAYRDQAEVLAPNDFEQGVKMMKHAQEELGKEDNEMEEFYDAAAYSRAYFERALRKADQASEVIAPIVKARQSALEAGVNNFSDTKERKAMLDNKLKKASDDFADKLNVDDYSELQRDYLNLEVESVQRKKLKKAMHLIAESRKLKASKKAPLTYELAKKDLAAAQNIIAQNPRKREEFQLAVDRSHASAEMLAEVIGVIRDRGGHLGERVAIELVNKNKELKRHKSVISSLEDSVDQAQNVILNVGEELSKKTSELVNTEGQLQKVEKEVNIQAIMDSVSQQFSSQEAEVYQQGHNLIIRLRKVDFPFGEYLIPRRSFPLLKKVENIVSKLNAKELVVEGHTDSVGPDEVNKELSFKRAESVAKFLKNQGLQEKIRVEGFGSSRPLAANETQKGRAQNRRVDIKVVDVQ